MITKHIKKISNADLVNGKLVKQYPDVTGYFDCSSTNITSLKGAPKEVYGTFDCAYTKITSLIGAPNLVAGGFYCYHTNITSLKGIGKDYLQEVGGVIHLNLCHNLTSHMLGIMRIKKLKKIYFDINIKVEAIFNKHLSSDRDIIACQEELMEAGFKEFAKL
jgi:hypothetical protein